MDHLDREYPGDQRVHHLQAAQEDRVLLYLPFYLNQFYVSRIEMIITDLVIDLGLNHQHPYKQLFQVDQQAQEFRLCH